MEIETRYRGRRLAFTVFGGSHTPELGIHVTGLPAGEAIELAQLHAFLERRAPGRYAWSTARNETDLPIITSGLADGLLSGEALHAMIRNENADSRDYLPFRDIPRPMHADYTAYRKYGERVNMAGGGPFSGRMTAPVCILGGICLQLLAKRGITIGAHIARIHTIHDTAFDPVRIDADTLHTLQAQPFPVLDAEKGMAMQDAILNARQDGDSLGGIVECAAIGLPAGLGGPLTDGMESSIAQLVFGIPAVKGVDFGAGFDAAALRGSEHNDAFCLRSGSVATETNRHGGILGGITSGMPLLFRTAIKPTPSITKEQQSVSLHRMEPAVLKISGRHDPCIVPRAVPVVEAVCAIALLDALLEGNENGTV